MEIQTFCFNPFAENTYVLRSGSDTVVVDPGCYSEVEEQELLDALSGSNLKGVWLTHSHLDHMLGVAFLFERFGVQPRLHKEDMFTWDIFEKSAAVWGVPLRRNLPDPGTFLKDGEFLLLGEQNWEVRFAPGHAKGHVIFVNHSSGVVMSGDVLFAGSIGRTDLPGGDFNTLSESIKQQLYTLPEHFEVYPGHGPSTSIGAEKRGNPFVRA